MTFAAFWALLPMLFGLGIGAPDAIGQVRRVVVEDTFRRPFRAESLTVTVDDPLPPPLERIARIVSVSAEGVLLRFETQAGEKIVVEYSDDLLEWEQASDELIGTGDEMDYLDDGSSTEQEPPRDSPARFYRVVFSPVE